MAFCNKTRGTGKKPKTPSPMTTRVVLLFVVLVIVPFFIMAAFVVRIFRDYNITKKEWVLNGATVLYGSATELRATLDYDFSEEKKFSYKNLSMDEIIHHLAFFISRLWQIHVFGEGNTGTTAVFLRNLLLNENHPLHNRILHISGTFKEPEKVNIDSGKSEH